MSCREVVLDSWYSYLYSSSTRVQILSTCTVLGRLVLFVLVLGLLELLELYSEWTLIWIKKVIGLIMSVTYLCVNKVFAQYSHLRSTQATGTPSMHLRKYLEMDDDDADTSCCLSFWQKNMVAVWTSTKSPQQANVRRLYMYMLCKAYFPPWWSCVDHPQLPNDSQDFDVTCFS